MTVGLPALKDHWQEFRWKTTFPTAIGSHLANADLRWAIAPLSLLHADRHVLGYGRHLVCRRSDRHTYLPRATVHGRLSKEHARGQGHAVPKLQRERASWLHVLRTVRDCTPIRMSVLRTRQSSTKQVLLRLWDQPQSWRIAASSIDSMVGLGKTEETDRSSTITQITT
jgi:hypothetical protein